MQDFINKSIEEIKSKVGDKSPLCPVRWSRLISGSSPGT